MTVKNPMRPADPWQIVRDPKLDDAAKLKRLRELEYDARHALVAAEEGMAGAGAIRLPSILAALNSLNADHAPLRSQTKA